MTTWTKDWPYERFAALPLTDRYELWRNANRLGATDLVAAIEGSGLEFWVRGGTRHDDPIAHDMEEIINSSEGREACLAATALGLPALGGVEPLIVKQLGKRYGVHAGLTVLAGYQVGTLMKSLGYEEVRKGKMPEGSVATTAAVWAQKPR